VSPLPLALIHSIRDEYVPVSEARNVFAHAQPPRRLWIVNASDHRFSNNTGECDQRLFDAIDWIHAHQVH